MNGSGASTPWEERLAPAALAIALGLALIAALARALEAIGLEAELVEQGLFTASVLLLPLLVAGILLYLIRPSFDRPPGPAEIVIALTAVFCMAALTALIVLPGLGLLEFGSAQLLASLIVNAGIPTSLLAVLAAGFGWGRAASAALGRAFLANAVLLAAFFFVIALHGTDPLGQRYLFPLNMLLEPELAYRTAALVAGALFATAIFRLIRFEAAAIGTARLHTLQRRGLIAAIIGTMLYFDFGLPTEPFHYFVNIGPALAALNGRVLMVDAFSQYGLGPVIVTIFGFLAGPHTLGTASIVVQLHNLAFYAVWLVCLTRMTRFRLTAAALGFAGIGLFLTLWGYGGAGWNVNVAPSIGGFRYLPALLMVLAISALPHGKRFSVWTALALAYATFWSVETMIAALGIHWGLIGLTGIRERSLRSIVTGAVCAALPALATILLIALAIFAYSGRITEYGTLLMLLSGYAAEDHKWLKLTEPDFFGWLLPLMVVFVPMTLAWRIALSGARSEYADTILTRFMPMALLAACMAFYFAGRSISGTLAICTLPVFALIIPGLIEIIHQASATQRGRWKHLAAPFAAVLWIGAVPFGFLMAPGSEYRLLVQECRDHGNCSPARLIERLSLRLHQRPPLETTGQTLTDLYPDTEHVVRDTVAMIERWGAGQSRVSLFLGPVTDTAPPIQIAPEFALLYTGKWHTWPRMVTRMDEIYYPYLRERILKADVELSPGSLVIARKNRTPMTSLEAALLAKIETKWDLCPLPDSAENIAAFRTAVKGQCSSLPRVD